MPCVGTLREPGWLPASEWSSSSGSSLAQALVAMNKAMNFDLCVNPQALWPLG